MSRCFSPFGAVRGFVDAKEFTYGGGTWAKLGFMMLTAKRVDFEQSNAKIEAQRTSSVLEAARGDVSKALQRGEDVSLSPGLVASKESFFKSQDDEIGYVVDKHALDY